MIASESIRAVKALLITQCVVAMLQIPGRNNGRLSNETRILDSGGHFSSNELGFAPTCVDAPGSVESLLHDTARGVPKRCCPV